MWAGVRQTALLVQQGLTDSALCSIRRLLPQADSLHSSQALTCLRAQAGMCLEAQQLPAEALREYEQGISICEQGTWLRQSVEKGQEQWLNFCLTMYVQTALIHEKAGRRQQALEAARHLVPWLQCCKNSRMRTNAVLAVGPLLMEMEQPRKTEALLAQVYRDAKATGRQDQMVMASTFLLTLHNNQLRVEADSLSALNRQSATVQTPQPDTLPTSKAMSNSPLPADESPKDAVPHGIGAIAVLLAVITACFLAYAIVQRRQRNRQKARSYLEGREEERQRLARELHDGVSNQLLAVQMKLSADGSTEQALQLLDESREQVRRVSHGLMPPEFSSVALDEVIDHYISELNAATPCDISCSFSPPDADWASIPQEQALAAYRIVQEAVGNALKHSGATTIAVGLQRAAHKTVVIVSDNGTAKPASDSFGIGKRNMQQRADAIGAQLDFSRGAFGNVVKLVLN